MNKYLFISESKKLFNRQKYIVDALKKEQLEIDYLFLEDISKKYDIFKLNHYYINHIQSFSTNLYVLNNIISKEIQLSDYSWIIITYDMTYSMQRLIELINIKKIPTFLIFHEWIFFDITKWHKIPGNLLNKIFFWKKYLKWIPMAKYIFPWWKIHKEELNKRWYSWNIFLLWTNKFEKYTKLSLNKKLIIKKIWIKNYKWEKIITYICQLFDNQINTSKWLNAQKKAISDLIKYCKKNKYILIIRSIIWLQLHIWKEKNIYFDWINWKYKSLPEENLYISDWVFWFNSTMLIESMLLNKPTFSFKYIKYHSFFATNKYMQEINNLEELNKINIINYNKEKNLSLNNLIWENIEWNIKEITIKIEQLSNINNYINNNLSLIYLLNPLWIFLLLKDYIIWLIVYITRKKWK